MANKKQTSKEVATKASKILKDDRYSEKSKSVAGSALSQTEDDPKPKPKTDAKPKPKTDAKPKKK